LDYSEKVAVVEALKLELRQATKGKWPSLQDPNTA
jgi:hypothetical protein